MIAIDVDLITSDLNEWRIDFNGMSTDQGYFVPKTRELRTLYFHI